MRKLTLSLAALALAACTGDATAPATEAASDALFSRSSHSCMNVAGTIVGNVFGGSVVTGDLPGLVVAYAAPISEPRGPSLHITTFHRFILGDGTFDTIDRGVMAPVDLPLYRLNNRYEVQGGTGGWADASGFLSVKGTLVIDFTGQDPRNGDIDATYRGRVCR
jgi:hypothetical protein